MESVENAIGDCKAKHFSVSKYARLLQRDRIDNRVAKLENRGWTRKADILESGHNFPVKDDDEEENKSPGKMISPDHRHATKRKRHINLDDVLKNI